MSRIQFALHVCLCIILGCCLVNSVELDKDFDVSFASVSQSQRKRSATGSNIELHDISHQWIIHMHKECTHTEFIDYLNQFDIHIMHQHSTLLHGVSISGLMRTEELYQNMYQHVNNMVILDEKHVISKCVKRIVPNGIKKIAVVDYKSSNNARNVEMESFTKPFYSWGTDRLDQKDLPLDQQYSSTYDGSGVDVFVIDTGIDTKHCEFGKAGGGTACHSSYDSSRTVRNIYDAFGTSHKALTRLVDQIQNIDDVGHGSHVSGTIGGANLGVAPGVNLYGVKVLNSQGEGTTSDTVAGLEYAVQFARNKAIARSNTANPIPSVVSMSLGGPCDIPNDCAEDTLAMAVESMIVDHHFIVSVAAGNEGCNACSGSPNAAPSAIRAGAVDSTDTIPYFSNYGACVSVFAPGVDITSVCSSLICSNSENAYSVKSGTSMACPHVSGVIAQLIQKSVALQGVSSATMLTPALISKALICDAAKGKLELDAVDTVSRDLILQVADSQVGSAANAGIVGQDCTDSLSECSHLQCSNEGICLPTRNEKQLQNPYSVFYDGLTLVPSGANGKIPSSCHCNYGYFGAHCQYKISDTLRESKDGTKLYLTCPTQSDLSLLFLRLFDVTGNGWKYAKYALVEAVNSSATQMYSVIDDAYDSLCYGQSEMRYYCVKDTVVHLEVSAGFEPFAIEWEMCGYFGGAPYHGLFSVSGITVSNTGEDDDQVPLEVSSCEFICQQGYETVITLIRDQDDEDVIGAEGGWEGAYYSILSMDGKKRLVGGTLSTGFTRNHTICLPEGEYLFIFDRSSSTLAPRKIISEICSVVLVGTQESIYLVVDSHYNCVGSVVATSSSDLTPNKQLSGIGTCGPREVTTLPFLMYDDILSDHGARNASMLLQLTKIGGFSSGDPSDVVYQEVLDFGMTGDICLADGCYDMDLVQYTQAQSSGSGAIGSLVPNPLGDNAIWNSTLGIAWHLCGFKSGSVPFHGHVCVERRYDMCYGLSGCPILKTYVHSSDRSLAIFTSSVPDPVVSNHHLHFIADAVPLHGVSELCELEDGCYEVFLGGGERNYANSSEQFHLCGIRSDLPATLTLCLSDSGSKCAVSNIVHKHCHNMSLIGNTPSRTFEHSFIKIDTYGDGWGESRYKIRSLPTGPSNSSKSVAYEGKKIAEGTLSDGGYGIDHLCLMEACYMLYITPSDDSNEIAWWLCGRFGNAVDALYDQHLHFCVDKNGNCQFLENSDSRNTVDDFDTVTDDDFPNVDENGYLTTDLPTSSPTSAPTRVGQTFAPSSLPTIITSQPTYAPSPGPTAFDWHRFGPSTVANIRLLIDLRSSVPSDELNIAYLTTSIGFSVQKLLETVLSNYSVATNSNTPANICGIEVKISSTTIGTRSSGSSSIGSKRRESVNGHSDLEFDVSPSPTAFPNIYTDMHATSVDRLKHMITSSSIATMDTAYSDVRVLPSSERTYNCEVTIQLISRLSNNSDRVSNYLESVEDLQLQQHVVANIMQYSYDNRDYEYYFDRVYYFMDRDGNTIDLINFRMELLNVSEFISLPPHHQLTFAMPGANRSVADYDHLHFPSLRGVYNTIISSTMSNPENDDESSGVYGTQTLWLYLVGQPWLLGGAVVVMILLCVAMLFYGYSGCKHLGGNATNKHVRLKVEDSLQEFEMINAHINSSATGSGSDSDVEVELKESAEKNSLTKMTKVKEDDAYTYNVLRPRVDTTDSADRTAGLELEEEELRGEDPVEGNQSSDKVDVEDGTTKGGGGVGFGGVRGLLSNAARNTKKTISDLKPSIGKQNKYDRVADFDGENEV